MYEDILNHCNFLLHNVKNNAIDYLQSRASEDYFTFGYFPKLNKISLIKDYFSESYLKELNLLRKIENNFSFKQISYFENYELIIGFKNIYGENISIIGRCLDDYKNLNIPKYKNTVYKKSNNLFGLYESLEEIKKLDYVIITEGQFDVIKAFDKGIKNIVAVGSSHISQNQFLLLKRFTNNIYLCLDNDDAGRFGENSFINKYKDYCNVKKIHLPPEYKDLDEFLSVNSKDDLI